jgi:NAD(P)-dependent dehydrogenase (short-subunit alcohol dehydrogenase family)
MFDFSNQVAMITGATGNLGAATVHTFYAAGANLVLVDRNAEKQGQHFADLAGDPRCLLVSPVDLVNPAAIQTVVDNAVARFGRLDILVHTVGGYQAGAPLDQTPLEMFDYLHNLNVRTLFVVAQAVIRQMRTQQAGRIITVAARAGLAGAANAAAYSAAKAAVIRLTESMAAELRPAGITANCLLPGTIDTPENRRAMPKADFTRWVQPAALAGVILYLASPASQEISGAAVPVYGQS